MNSTLKYILISLLIITLIALILVWYDCNFSKHYICKATVTPGPSSNEHFIGNINRNKENIKRLIQRN